MKRHALLFSLIVCTSSTALWAQQDGTGQAAPAASAPAADKPAFKQEELDQMLAPIALYPDSLLSQVLMASTYPVEVVEADRWAKKNAALKGDELAAALEKQPWDPSVRSLVNFPDVLSMMSENLSTTVKIGDAFIGQQKEVMDTIQTLRAKAKDAGNLSSNEQQNVTVSGTGSTQVIVVESASPQVIYVPQYNPTVVYGTWWYPSYPPYPYYPPGYVASNALSFGLGVACGVAWGYAWGNCNWHGGDIDIDINRNINLNTQINRANFQRTQASTFQHNPAHRQGVAYRNQSSAQRVGASTTNTRAAQARNDYRGRADAGRDSVQRGSPSRPAQPTARPSQPTRPQQADRGNRGSALSDASRSGASTRQSSSRGSSSRASSPSSRATPSRSGGGSRGGRR